MHEVIGYSDNALREFFNSSKNQPWFKNTLFVITADHSNQFWYPFYSEGINRFAIPIIFYHPDNSFVGVNNKLAQQLDIFPSIIDLIGYDKPINAWGRSLFTENLDKPFSIHFSGTVYRFSMNQFTLVFDGDNVIGVYNIDDYALNKNLINDDQIDYSFEEQYLKAFFQDYMERVIDGKLN